MRRALRSNPQDLKQSDYNEWKANPVTKRLLTDLTHAVLGQYEDPLPNNIPEAVPAAFERQGFYRLLTEIVEWYPTECKPLGGEE